MSKKRIACIDFGLKRIGMALSDPSQILASSFGTLKAKKTPMETANALLEAFAGQEIEKLVIGNPLHLDGKESPLSRAVQAFTSLLREKAPFEIVLVDERLSTRQADRILKENALNRKKRAKVIDTLSAVLILESYLAFPGMEKIPNL